MKTAGDAYVYESYYDDYTPEMENEYAWQQGNENFGTEAAAAAAAAAQQNEYYQQNENDSYTAEGQQNQQFYPQQ